MEISIRIRSEEMNEIPRHGKLTSPRSTYQDCLARTLHAIEADEKRRGIWIAAVSLGMNAQAIE
jgi:hypothetical protein